MVRGSRAPRITPEERHSRKRRSVDRLPIPDGGDDDGYGDGPPVAPSRDSRSSAPVWVPLLVVGRSGPQQWSQQSRKASRQLFALIISRRRRRRPFLCNLPATPFCLLLFIVEKKYVARTSERRKWRPLRTRAYVCVSMV